MNKIKFIFVFGSFIVIILILSCIRDKNPTEVNSIYNKYISSWPDSIIATGVGSVNPYSPVDLQQQGAFEAAKRVLLRNLLYKTYVLPVSSTKNIKDLMDENTILEDEIMEIVRHFEIIVTNYFDTGACEVSGFILTENIIDIISPFISESDS